MKSRKLLIAAVVAGVVGIGLGVAPRVSEAAKPPNPGTVKLDLGDAEQAIVITGASWTATTATAALFERSNGSWYQVDKAMTVRVGRKGFSRSHHEGDGTTPAGAYGIVSAFGRQPDPGVALPYRQTRVGDCWISDVTSPSYNRWVALAPCSAPNEDLYAIGAGAYRYALVTDYNQVATRGLGSAIFLHRHSYDDTGRSRPTSGCVSFEEKDLLTTMRWLNPAKHPRVIIGPAGFLKTGT